MKLTTAVLRKIIKEELSKIVNEADMVNMRGDREGDYPAFYNAISKAMESGGGDFDETERALRAASSTIARQYQSEDAALLKGFTDRAFNQISPMLAKDPRFKKLGKQISALQQRFEDQLSKDTKQF